MDYQKITIDDIISYCQEHNEVAWLKEIAKKKVEYKIYPRVNGKPDKSQAPTIKMQPISFIQIKIAFVQKFMPEIAPKGQKKDPTMYERIAAL